MEILVTGISGFIGGHLGERLLSEGYIVHGVDNFDPFYAKSVKMKNLENLMDHKNFRFYETDIRSEDFTLLTSNTNVDSIIHLAARAGVRPSLEFPQSYVHHDVEATVNLLEAAQRFDIENIVFGSSSSVYGNSMNLPYKEDENLNRPISAYAAAKLSCEMFNYMFHHNYGINITNLRFFTVYGPRQRPEMGIHKFTRLLTNNETIPMYGDGSSSRDYTYISDIIDGILLSLTNLEGYNIYNLGNSNPVKLIDLIHIIADTVGVEPNIKQLDMQPGDVDHTLADITKAKQELGYNPKISINEGVSKFVNWYNSKITSN